MAKRKHWMDEVAQSLRARSQAAIPHVAAGIRGEVPFGYQPPKRNDEVKAFLNMEPAQRQQLFIEMGPERYREWSSSMMKKLGTRLGPVAQVLMPMLEGAPIEVLADGVQSGDSSLGVAAAEVELAELLGFDPLS